MATIEFNAYQIHEVRKYYSHVTKKDEVSVTISFGIGKPPPFPSKTIEALNLKEIIPQFDAYLEEAKASGHKLQVRARVTKGRSPSGFDNAVQAQQLMRNVNI